MPRYNEFYYGTATYGLKSSLAFSAEPMQATALRYGAVALSYIAPSGSYTEFRIVRNQNAYPQTQEDGLILYQSPGTPDGVLLKDDASKIAPLVPGKFVYYRAWLRKSANSDWVPAGDTYTLIPDLHTLDVGHDAKYTSPSVAGTDELVSTQLILDPETHQPSAIYGYVDLNVSTTHDRFMGLIPKVLTTTTNSPLDARQDQEIPGTEDNSTLSMFLSAFSFTIDEFLTYAKLVTPDNPGHGTSPAILALRSHELGMPSDVDSVTSTQKKLLRNAISIYSTKGTKKGLSTFVESITGYDTVLEDTTNLLLSHEDSTFDIVGWKTGESVGSWFSLSSSPVLSVVTGQNNLISGIDVSGAEIALVEPGSLDLHFCAKVVTGGTNQKISLGIIDSVTRGIPVTAGTDYALSFYARNSAGANVTPEVRFFDRNGVLILTGTGISSATSSSWAKIKQEYITAPAGAEYAGIVLTFAANSTYYLDLVQFEASSTATAYQEPRGVIVTLNPPKTNLITNPSFEVNTTGWSMDNVSSSSASTGSAFYGGKALLLASDTGTGLFGTNTTSYIDVTPGSYYSASAYLKDVSSSVKYTIAIEWYQGSGHTLISRTTSSPVSINTSSWTRLAVSAIAPVLSNSSTPVTARVFILSEVHANAGSQVYIDSAQFEQNESARDYFDGSITDTGAAWAGTANASVSYQYPALSNRATRLQGEIEKYLSFNTPYYVNYYGGAFSGIA